SKLVETVPLGQKDIYLIENPVSGRRVTLKETLALVRILDTAENQLPIPDKLQLYQRAKEMPQLTRSRRQQEQQISETGNDNRTMREIVTKNEQRTISEITRGARVDRRSLYRFLDEGKDAGTPELVGLYLQEQGDDLAPYINKLLQRAAEDRESKSR